MTDGGEAARPRSALRRAIPRWARVAAVGALVGIVPPVVVEAVLVRLAAELVPEREPTVADAVLAFLAVAPFLVPVVVVTVVATTLAAWLALRLLGVPRALLVAGVSAVVLGGAAAALLYNDVYVLDLWWCALASSVVHVVVWAVASRPRR